MFYFAYGSNCSLAQMARRCPDAQPVGTVTLEGYRLTFVGDSKTWGGGVATVVPAEGESVQGVLYCEIDWKSLDRYEGHPHCYRRTTVRVTLESGNEIDVVTYRHLRDDTAAPSDAYVDRIETGYLEHGLDTDPLYEAVETAMNEDIEKGAAHIVFVYGTLRYGEGNWRWALSDSEFLGEVVADGFDMYDLGAFPGIVPGDGSVVGELFLVDTETLGRLDHLEGVPYLYRREEIETEGIKAWTYVYNGEPEGRLVPGGDWLANKRRTA